MKKPEITPGPWSLQEKRKDGFWIDSIPLNDEPEEIALASTSTIPVKQARANATAIAALPDLLEALERVLPSFEPRQKGALKGYESPEFQLIKAALAKAGYTFD